MSDNVESTYIDDYPDAYAYSTIPPGTERIPVAPISQWLRGVIYTVLAFPAEMDVERLNKAIGLLLAVWPTLGGRLERHQRGDESLDQWDFSLKLTSSPIPFSTQTIHAPSAFPTLDVIQPSLVPYVSPLSKDYMTPNSDSHLFAVRLTTLLPSRSSVLGVTFAHVLGDGAACLRMIRVLEAFYLHGQAALDTITKPTFFGHVTLPEWDAGWHLPSDTLVGHPDEEWGKAYANAAAGSEPVLVTLTKNDARALLEKCRLESGLALSTQDAISGWWISLMQRLGEEVKTLIYVINYRTLVLEHPAFPADLPTSASNVAQMRWIDLPTQSTATPSPSEIASCIRKEILRLRSDPETTLQWLSNAAHHIERAAVEGKGQILVPPPGQVTINANIRMDWHATFGFPPDQTSYHCSWSGPRFLRVFQGNPRPGENAGDRIELVFNVPRGRGWAERLAELVMEDKKQW